MQMCMQKSVCRATVYGKPAQMRQTVLPVLMGIFCLIGSVLTAVQLFLSSTMNIKDNA